MLVRLVVMTVRAVLRVRKIWLLWVLHLGRGTAHSWSAVKSTFFEMAMNRV